MDSYPYLFILPFYGLLKVTDLAVTVFLSLLQLADLLMGSSQAASKEAKKKFKQSKD